MPPPPPPPPPPSSSTKGSQSEEAAGEDDDNAPPPFPLPNSIQRSRPTPTFNLEEPPDDDDDGLGGNDEDDDEEGYGRGSALPPVRIEKGSLSAPTSTTKLPPRKKRAKVSIEPGFSQLDWGRLQKSGIDLRGGVTQLMRVTPSMLAQHRTKEDCWQVYGGKVYNVTPFLKYHPGGVPELMRAAGKDGTELFMRTHAWVNADLMLDGCLVGFYVRGD